MRRPRLPRILAAPVLILLAQGTSTFKASSSQPLFVDSTAKGDRSSSRRSETANESCDGV